ncbi:MAG: signal peptidase I [Acidobacteria bacterium]|nr:signal peptidase I [Acidobacteriota bacterium]
MTNRQNHPPSPGTDPPPAPRRRKRHTYFFNARYWLRDLILSICIALAIVFFLYQPVQVEGTSMMPRLGAHQRLLVNKFLYKFEPIARGDIVVFRFPGDPSKSYIKRVVGLPGDQVEVQEGRVIIDNKVLREPYLAPGHGDRRSYSMIQIPPGHYYVMGDHRDSSHDSRQWGTVHQSSIYGKAVFCYWPFESFGSVD